MLKIDASFPEFFDNLFFIKQTLIFVQKFPFEIWLNTVVVEHDLMVAGNNYFMSEVELLKKSEEFLEMLLLAVVSEISSMNENIAFHLQNFA
jgi:hypothetical protein